jgi:Domain of unknown function (DUF4337)
MGHTTDKRLEHAEHTQHHAHDPFDRRVAMSMAIIAAVLAGVTLLSHRGHTETLKLQAEANSIETEAAQLETLANVHHTKESDQWAFYQAKNIRSHEFQSNLRLISFLAKEPGTEKQLDEAQKYWATQVERYEGKPGKDGKRREAGELAALKADAESLKKKAEEYHEKAEKKLDEAKESERESHQVHHSVNWIDSGHLGIELALVLCSVAVLTKQRSFWFSGIGIALIGAGLAGVGVYLWLFAQGAHH